MKKKKRKIHYSSGRERIARTPEGVTIKALDLAVAGKKKTKEQLIGWGEFEPADRSRSVMFVRYAFLETIREMERKKHSQLPGGDKLKVLKDLSGRPFEEFRKSGLGDARTKNLSPGTWGDHDAELNAFWAALRDWAERWGLNAPWCMAAAVDTLMMWRDHDVLVKSLRWEVRVKLEPLLTRRARGKARRSNSSDREPFDPRVAPPTWAHSFLLDKESRTLLRGKVIWEIPLEWLPPFFAHMELRRLYENRTRVMLLRHLRTNPFTASLSPATRRLIKNESVRMIEEYCDRVMRFYRRQKDEAGASRWKQTETSADLGRDLRWLVERQVRGRSATEIAEFEGVATSTVTNATNKLLSLLELPERIVRRRRRP